MATIQKVQSGIIVTFKAPIELNITSTNIDAPFHKKIYHKDSRLAKYIHQLSPSESKKLSEIYEELQLRLSKIHSQGNLRRNPEAQQLTKDSDDQLVGLVNQRSVLKWDLTEMPKLHDMRAYRPSLSDSLFLPMNKDICEQLKKIFTTKLEATITFTGFTIKDSFGGVFSQGDQLTMQEKIGNTYTAYPNFNVTYKLSAAESIDVEF